MTPIAVAADVAGAADAATGAIGMSNGAISAENPETSDQHAYANDDGAPADEPEPVETELTKSSPSYESSPSAAGACATCGRPEQVVEAAQAKRTGTPTLDGPRTRAVIFRRQRSAGADGAGARRLLPRLTGSGRRRRPSPQPRRTGWWAKRLLGGG